MVTGHRRLEDADYNAVMNGDLTDGTIILMHDIHEPSVKAALRLIPDLIAQGYKLVTVSEMAEAKNVTLQNACYVDFWPSTLSNGDVRMEGQTMEAMMMEVRMTEVMMMEVQMIRKITVMIL